MIDANTAALRDYEDKIKRAEINEACFDKAVMDSEIIELFNRSEELFYSISEEYGIEINFLEWINLNL